jgi:hypothetical protein
VVARRQLAASREGTPPPLPVRARSATAALIDAATTKIRQRKRVKTTQPVLDPAAPPAVSPPPWMAWRRVAIGAALVALAAVLLFLFLRT